MCEWVIKRDDRPACVCVRGLYLYAGGRGRIGEKKINVCAFACVLTVLGWKNFFRPMVIGLPSLLLPVWPSCSSCSFFPHLLPSPYNPFILPAHHPVTLLHCIVLYMHCFVGLIHSKTALGWGLFDFAVCACISGWSQWSPETEQHISSSSRRGTRKPKVPFSSFASSAIQQTPTV